MNQNNNNNKFLRNGFETEAEFCKLFENAVKSNKYQDINEHWDLMINYKIDVKGLRKIKRSDTEVNENIHWVEIKNVNGKLGWLYGEADYFAFETIDYWIIIDKFKLQKLITDKTNKIYHKTPTLYSLYRRDGRKRSGVYC